MTMVRPNRSRSLRTSSSTPPALTGSRPAVGSSRNSSSGSRASARAREARFIMPPLSSDGYCAPTSGLRPVMASFHAAISSINTSSSSVCSRSGKPTFSFTVSEPNKPPCWNITPQRRRSARASSSPSLCRSTPSTRMEPECGRCSRIISRSSVVLPEPMPPINANISARRTSRSSSECTTWSPKRVDTLLISMTLSSLGTASVCAALSTSEVQRTEGDREQAVGNHHEENRLNDAARGLAADAVGAAFGAEALKAADHGDDGGEYRCFADADQIGSNADRLDEAVEKLAEADAELRARHDHAAEYAEHVRKYGQQRQRDHQRDDLRQNQQIQRRDSDGAHGVDLLGHGHRADLRGVGGARAPGDDDGGDQRRELAQHRQTDEVGHENVGAVLPELVGALIGDNDPEQERQQPDDGQCVESGAAYVVQDGTPPESRRVRDASCKRGRTFADETEQRNGLFEGSFSAPAQAFKLRRAAVEGVFAGPRRQRYREPRCAHHRPPSLIWKARTARRAAARLRRCRAQSTTPKARAPVAPVDRLQRVSPAWASLTSCRLNQIVCAICA